MTVTVSFNRNQYQIENANYYVAPVAFGGSDSNPGTISQPFATLQKAVNTVGAGQLVYIRGGTYTVSSPITIGSSGTSGNYKRIWAYPGEAPIIDGSGIGAGGTSNSIIYNDTYGWWHIKGLVTRRGPSAGICWTTNAHDSIIEFCESDHNLQVDTSGAGIVAGGTGVFNVTVKNCDSHHTNISYTTGLALSATGGDGIDMTESKLNGNVIDGCRVWGNNDDGVDTWNSYNVTCKNSWSWGNGYDEHGTRTSGDGTGFKFGGGPALDSGFSSVYRNIAWRNGSHGFSTNYGLHPMTFYNNTAWEQNETGAYSFVVGQSAGVANVLRNNLSYITSGNHCDTIAATVHDHNSWDIPVTVTSPGDFISTDFTANSGARQSDGSLPVSNFLRLAAGKPELDVGIADSTFTGFGLTYNGSAPDLGAYER